MKKMILLFSIMAVAFAASGQASISQALNELESATKALFIGLSVLSFAAGVVLGGIGAIIHFMKVKKIEKPGKWKPAAMVLMVLGALGLLGGVVCIILYVMTPAIVRGMTG